MGNFIGAIIGPREGDADQRNGRPRPTNQHSDMIDMVIAELRRPRTARQAEVGAVGILVRVITTQTDGAKLSLQRDGRGDHKMYR